MENIYLFFLIVLFLLAISDLIVGVGNDAVNFLNSAIGSKVAPMKIILSVAALGVLAGAMFSSGMMEIARSGVFYPQNFFFNEIIIIFLAVMIADVVLLDTFNTYGLPTSTTVSIIFELLGAAVAVSLIKIYNSTDTLSDLSTYINSGKALAIISGILLSVVIAFTFGTIIQFFTRLLFSFNYEKNLKRFGALWGGIAITSIVYFMLVKGAKGASFITEDALNWINHHTLEVLFYSFVFFTILLQVLLSFFRLNILRIIVLVGTFSLAMAFAGNDLVNFIGVPLAGYESIKLLLADPVLNPDTFTMEFLLNPVKTPTIFLLLAGFIMVLTLFFSKKSRTVTKTEVDLSRQGSGDERFSSSYFSRSIVRRSIETSKIILPILPKRLINFIENRFDNQSFKKKSSVKNEEASFDLLRASVNMFVASILIAFATSLKLPLSTTYVTFMVAMGTSLADRAWGRESAVYRITGVITVIGGWFITAFSAFTLAFSVALFIHWGGQLATIVVLILAIFFVIKTHLIHKRRSAQEHLKDENAKTDLLDDHSALEKCNLTVNHVVLSVSKLYFMTMHNLIHERRKELKKVIAGIEELNIYTKDLKNNLYFTLKKLEDNSIETGHFYVQMVDYMREISHCMKYISDPIYEHIDNQHPPLIPEQVKDLNQLNEELNSFFSYVLNTTKKQNFTDLNAILVQQQLIIDLISKINKKQIRLIKEELIGTRISLMYMNLLNETKNLVLYTINMVKAHRDFIQQTENDSKGII
jgi:phosphate/sulfate permease